MTVGHLIERVREAGIRMEADGHRLRLASDAAEIPGELADALRARRWEVLAFLERESAVPGASPPARSWPLSYAQERYWYLDRFEAGEAVYHLPLAFRLRGPLDVDALTRAFDHLRRRHEILRTRFRVVDGSPRQVVDAFEPRPLEITELGGGGDGGREARLTETLEALAKRPFDVERGPLVRVGLVPLGPEDRALYVMAHHAALDGRSQQLLIGELSHHYSAELRGEPSALPEALLQYRHHALRRRHEIEGTAGDRLMGYWRRRLEGAWARLDLPVDRTAPAVRLRPGAGVDADIAGALRRGLRALAAARSTTPFTVLYAAFQALLHRYTGESDLRIGSILEGRTRSDVESLLGCFVNTVVLRTDLSDDPPFEELLSRSTEGVFGALAHQDLPFDRLVRELLPRRGRASDDLLRVLFRSEGEVDPPEIEGVRAEVVAVDRGATFADLDLIVRESGDRTRLSLRFDTDLFEADTATRMLDHYLVVLGGALADPSRRVSELPLLPRAECHRIVVEWNATKTPVPACRAEELVRAQAERTPDAVAVVDESGRAVRYSDLVDRAGRIARGLGEAGVAPGDVVGLALDRDAALPAALLGVLGAGAAYLPLDPEFPESRLAFMLDDSGTRLVLAGREAARALPELAGGEVRILEEMEEGVPRILHPDGRDETTPHDPAYLIYTSGSTGRPKGVRVAHRSLVNFLRAMAGEPGFGPDERLLAVTTLGFDISVLELLLPLTVGATTVVASGRSAEDGRRLRRLLVEHGITVLQGTPATWRLLLDAGWDGDPPLRAFCGGESMPPDLARDLLERDAELWNLYGPTETTVWSTVHRVERVESPIPVGRPVANTRVYVLDRQRAPVPVGARGEIWIGGEGVSLGYHDRPALDAASFEPDPFGLEPGARRYRTGDLGRWRRDGVLLCLGRTDHQVKLRGFRIELEEIDAALSGIEGVRAAAADVRGDSPASARLVAYVVPTTPGTIMAGDVRARLRRVLPEYMIPAVVTELDELPLTASGKLDRSALPTPQVLAPDRADHAAPSTAVERLVASIWEELLEVSRVGLNDNFFDLGGHSLLSMRALLRIEDRTGVDVEARSMILQTLGQVAADVERRLDDPAAVRAHPT